MPTTSERQALAFVAAIALLGAGVRMSSARRFAHEVNVATGGALSADSGSPAALALAHQMAAVDSAKAARALRASSKRLRGGGGRAKGERRAPSSGTDDLPTPQRAGTSRGTRDLTQSPIDINRASAAELELLPRVGPALARRIIAWRETHGPFQSVESLRHVPGIGVTTSARLAPLVTF